jgi:hypothetical protein
MPSLDVISDHADSWVAQHKTVLLSFFEKIESCIEQSDWDALSEVLTSRQVYLEQLFEALAPEKHRAELKQLAQTILDRDAIFIEKVQSKKNIGLQQQLLFERGRRAVEAYNDQ